MDTCVISELAKQMPAKDVIDWVASNEESDMALSVLTIGEIQRGIARLKDGRRRNTLQRWLDNDLLRRFSDRLLPVSDQVARTWGFVQARAESAGRPLPSIDGLIGATAIAHDLTVVTRNEKDIGPTGARLLNPWTR